MILIARLKPRVVRLARRPADIGIALPGNRRLIVINSSDGIAIVQPEIGEDGQEAAMRAGSRKPVGYFGLIASRSSGNLKSKIQNSNQASSEDR